MYALYLLIGSTKRGRLASLLLLLLLSHQNVSLDVYLFIDDIYVTIGADAWYIVSGYHQELFINKCHGRSHSSCNFLLHEAIEHCSMSLCDENLCQISPN